MPGLTRTGTIALVPHSSQRQMRQWLTISVVLWIAAIALAADQPPATPLIPCPVGDASSGPCNPSKQDLKKAKTAFSKAMKLSTEKRGDEALEEFNRAVQLSPKNEEYVTALAMARQQMVFQYLQSGNQAMLSNHTIEAQSDFGRALRLDPDNDFAQQRMKDALSEWNPASAAPAVQVIDSPEVRLAANDSKHDFHSRGDSRQLIEQVAQAYGISTMVDDSVPSRRVWMDIDNADFYTAIQAACAVAKCFWSPLGDKQIIVALDTVDNHRQFDQMALRTFEFTSLAAPTELNDIANALRTVFEMRFVSVQSQGNHITVRAPQNTVDAATRFVEDLNNMQPQVMLDIQVFQLDHTFMRDIGAHLPNNFNLYNLPAAALAGLAGQSLQSILNQASSGGLSALSSGGLAGLLSQLQSGTGIFSQPLTTFGGGLTLSGLSLDQLKVSLSLNESSVRSLQHAMLRVAQNNEAVFKIGERYPVLTASFSSSVNTSAISQLLGQSGNSALAGIANSLGGGSLQTPFPSFQFEDIGLNMKAKPAIFGDSTIALALDIELRSLGSASVNGVPVISNREYKGSIQLKDGEPAIVMSNVSRTEQRSMTGIPGLGFVPVLNQALVENSKTTEDDELLVTITPHLVSHPYRDNMTSPEIWVSK